MSHSGTSRTSGDVRFESAEWARADIDQVAVTGRDFYEYKLPRPDLTSLCSLWRQHAGGATQRARERMTVILVLLVRLEPLQRPTAKRHATRIYVSQVQLLLCVLELFADVLLIS